MTLLEKLNSERAERNEGLRIQTRARLRSALHRLKPAKRIILFGSLVRQGEFGETSDVDLALETEATGMSLYQLTAVLAEETGHSVDVVLLPECRFRERIEREGERWTLPD